MKEMKFDMDQYTYLRNRSATDAIITVVEKLLYMESCYTWREGRLKYFLTLLMSLAV